MHRLVARNLGGEGLQYMHRLVARNLGGEGLQYMHRLVARNLGGEGLHSTCGELGPNAGGAPVFVRQSSPNPRSRPGFVPEPIVAALVLI